MSAACLYVLGKCGCSSGRQFPKFQFDLQRKQRSLFITHGYVWWGRNAGENVTALAGGWRL